MRSSSQQNIQDTLRPKHHCKAACHQVPHQSLDFKRNTQAPQFLLQYHFSPWLFTNCTYLTLHMVKALKQFNNTQYLPTLCWLHAAAATAIKHRYRHDEQIATIWSKQSSVAKSKGHRATEGQGQWSLWNTININWIKETKNIRLI